MWIPLPGLGKLPIHSNFNLSSLKFSLLPPIHDLGHNFNINVKEKELVESEGGKGHQISQVGKSTSKGVWLRTFVDGRDQKSDRDVVT